MAIILKDSIIVYKEGDTATAQNNNTTLVIQQYKVGGGSWSSQPPSNLRPGEKIYTRFEYSYFIRGQRQKAYIPSEDGQEDLTWTFASALQDQVDGVINTWFGDEVPIVGIPRDDNNDSIQDTEKNGDLLWNKVPIPYGDWNSTNIDSNNTHLGDIYFNNSTGTAYRFVWENEGPKWKEIVDEPMTQLLAQINSIKDTVDTKVSVFSSDSEPAAEINDLWAKNNQITLIKTEKGWDIFNCTVTNIKKLYASILESQTPTLETLVNFEWEDTIPSWSPGNSIWEITISLYVEDGLFDDLEFSKEPPPNKTHFVHITTNEGVIFKENIGTNSTPNWTDVTIDGSVIDVTKPVCISVANRDVSRVESQYAASNDNQNAPTSGWDTKIKDFNSTNCYLWQKVITYYNTNDYDESDPAVCAFYSKDFQQIEVYYCLHNSSTEPPEAPIESTDSLGDWSSSPPSTNIEYRYLWMIQRIVFDNGTKTDFSSPVLVSIDPVSYKLQLEVTEESPLAEISNSELEITGKATITITATLLDNSVEIKNDSRITYSWYENGDEVISKQPENKYSFDIDLDDSEIIISCIAELNGNEITRETITFSRIYSAKSFILSPSAKAKRFIYNEKINSDPDNTNGNTSYELSSNILYITVSQIVDETTSSIGQDKIWVQDKDGSLESIDFDNEFNAYKFSLRDWYTRNYTNEDGDLEEPQSLNDIIKFYLDSNGQTFIDYMEFEDGIDADQMKFFITSAKMQAMIDNNGMVFDTNGLHLYNGNFEICKAETDSRGNIDVDKLSEAKSVLYFNPEDAKLVVKGHIEAESGSFKGYIEAGEGKIGSWEISEKYLASMVDDTKKRFLISSAVDSDSLNWIQATDKNGSVAFKVSKDGYLTATGADITGVITANTGHIGGINGWIIKAGAIYSGTTSLTSTAVGTYIGTDGIRNYSSDNACVNIQNGILTATDADIAGTIKAKEGYIGGSNGWIIGENKIYSYNGPTDATSNETGVFFGQSSEGNFILRINNANTYNMIFSYLGSYLTGNGYGVKFGSLSADGYIEGKQQFSASIFQGLGQDDEEIDIKHIKRLTSIRLTDNHLSVGTFYAPNPNPESDKRLKNNILYFSSDLVLSNSLSSFFDDLKPTRFCYNYDSSNCEHFGFIAQDIAESLDKNNIPQEKLCLIKKDSRDYYTLNYVEFIPLLVYEIQKLKKEIDKLTKI